MTGRKTVTTTHSRFTVAESTSEKVIGLMQAPYEKIVAIHDAETGEEIPQKSPSTILRADGYSRDGYACRICGAPGTRWSLQVHHLTPVRFGGSSEPANLVTLCPECHARLHREHREFRGARTFEDDDAEEWA